MGYKDLKPIKEAGPLEPVSHVSNSVWREEYQQSKCLLEEGVST